MVSLEGSVLVATTSAACVFLVVHGSSQRVFQPEGFAI